MNETKVSTGFRGLDTALGGGLERGKLTVLASRPAMGKTTLALGMAAVKHGDHHDRVIAVFSLENTGEDTGIRLLCQLGNVEQRRYLRRIATNDEHRAMAMAAAERSKMALFVDDHPAADDAHLKNRCQDIFEQHGRLDLVIVDYLQLMRGTQSRGRSADYEIKEICAALKSLALRFDCAVLALSQMPRTVECRKDRRPRLTDIPNVCSGADTVMGLYRADAYKDLGTPAGGSAEVLILKSTLQGRHRYAELYFDEKIPKFFDIVTGPTKAITALSFG